VQLFVEVKRHKPSVIYIPNVDVWWETMSPAALSIFLGLLRSIPPTEPILIFGTIESEPGEVDARMLKELFGYSRKNQFELPRPDKPSRYEFFSTVISNIRKAPIDFPDPTNRKKRELEILVPAPPPPPKEVTAEDLKAQKMKDRYTLNILKIRIQPVMDHLKLKYKKFRTGVIDLDQIRYLLDEQERDQQDAPVGDIVPARFRPYEKAVDKDGVQGLREVATGKFFYNMEIVTMELRLSNGYYDRPKDFLEDIRRLAKDAKAIGDRERTIKANELIANVEVDMAGLEQLPELADCENLHIRQEQRKKAKAEKAARLKALEDRPMFASTNATVGSGSQSNGLLDSEPVNLGENVPQLGNPIPVTPGQSSLSNGVTSNGHATGSDSSQHLAHSNGSIVPSRPSDVDVHMSGTEDTPNSNAATQGTGSAPSGPETQSQPSQAQWIPPQRGQSNLSSVNTNTQQGAVMGMALDSQLDNIVNNASTTTSGKKTSDRTDTQSTNGPQPTQRQGPAPDFAGFGEKSMGDSDLPDTQGNYLDLLTPISTHNLVAFANDHSPEMLSNNSGSSQPLSQSQPASQPPVPHFNAPAKPVSTGPAAMNLARLSNPVEEPTRSVTLTESIIQNLHEALSEESSGFSVEQLEQINTALMDTVWMMRGEWDRNTVAGKVEEVFNENAIDIKEMQAIMPASFP
jgi:ATPase family AAA domain-containing protein 2